MVRILPIAWAFILAGWSAEAAELRLREEASVAGGMVRLADVAEVVGDDSAALQSVLLFPAPSAGKERIVRRSEIQELLSLADIDAKRATWSGADRVVIRRVSGTGGPPAKTTSAARPAPGGIEQSVQHALVSYLETQQPGDVAWSVAPAIPSRYLSPLKEADQITVAGGQAPFTGRQSFQIVARVQGYERRIPIEADVAALPRAVVAARAINKGQVIRPEDVEMQPLATATPLNDRLLARDEIIGHEAIKGLNPGQPITASAVQLPRLVRRGDKVTVRSLAAGVSITTNGKAIQDGALGDSIPVELDDPKRQILAQITGPQCVEIGRAEPNAVKPAAAHALKTATIEEPGIMLPNGDLVLEAHSKVVSSRGKFKVQRSKFKVGVAR